MLHVALLLRRHGDSQTVIVNILHPTIPRSSLATGPRFVETPAMTTLGGYVTGTRGQVCVVPKTQQGYT